METFRHSLSHDLISVIYALLALVVSQSTVYGRKCVLHHTFNSFYHYLQRVQEFCRVFIQLVF